MVIGNTKKVLYKILPYEYKSLERHLEEMALKGWKLEYITGAFLSFIKIDSTRIRYWVDVEGTNPLKINSEEIQSEYRDIGWNLIYSENKINIYSREDGIEEFYGYIHEEEKFKEIAKLSLKNMFMSFIAIIIFILPMISEEFEYLIVSDAGVIMKFLAAVLIVYEITHIYSFLTWYIKGKNSLRRNEEVSYEAHWLSKGRIVINTIVVLAGGISIAMIAIFTTDSEINGIIGFMMLILIVLIFLNFVVKQSEEALKKRRIDVFNIVGLILLVGILVGRNYLHGDINFNNNYSVDKEFKLSLEDFNDKSIINDNYHYSESKGLFASKLWVYDNGENGELDYNLFESKYKWIIDKYLKDKIEWLEGIGGYSAEIIDNDGEVTLYTLAERDCYILASENKVIEFRYLKYKYDIDEFINIVHEEVFLDEN